MASDQEYMDFLNKANEDPTAGYPKNAASTSASKTTFKTQDTSAAIPASIKAAAKDVVYTSDADEPFVPVALKWEDKDSKGLPDEEEFARLIQHWDPAKAEIEILDPADWDKNGDYSNLLDAVTEAVEGNDVKVYRIVRDGSRVEYWLIGREGSGKDARIVGVKALAIES